MISSNKITGEGIIYDNEQQRERRYTPNEIPNIVDVANPFNNVYKSGVANYFSKDPEGSYHPGQSNWTNFATQIDTFELSKPIN